MSTKDSISKATEKLDKAAGAAPSSDPVDVDDFGLRSDAEEDDHDSESTEDPAEKD